MKKSILVLLLVATASTASMAQLISNKSISLEAAKKSSGRSSKIYKGQQ